jgi:CheY-like chemotaxis protein
MRIAMAALSWPGPPPFDGRASGRIIPPGDRFLTRSDESRLTGNGDAPLTPSSGFAGSPGAYLALMDRLIRLLLVEDDTRIRAILAMRICCEPDLRIVCEVATPALALEPALALAPDVIVVDLNVERDTRAMVHHLRALARLAPLVVLSADDRAARRVAADAGAAAFVAKQDNPDQLLATIRAAAAADGGRHA